LIYTLSFILGGVMVVCLPLDPRFVSSDSVEGDEFLRAIKFHSTPSFEGEVKMLAPCCKILWHVKDTFEVRTKILLKAKFIISFAVSFCFATK
jgi:hypothetical protein